MKGQLLQRLLGEPEGPTLEFKRAWYGIDDPAAKQQQRDELIKDILSLANGSPGTVGRDAYLIIGADDSFDSAGRRCLHDVGDLKPESLRQTIVQCVSSASEPALQDIRFDVVEIDGARLAVITIPPSPHLHEITRGLLSFSERTVFIRRGDSIGVASATDRDAISRLKRLHFHETRKAPPVAFGFGIGAIVGGLALLGQAVQQGQAIPQRIAALMAGAVLFGLVGASIGFGYRQVADMSHRWELLPPGGRVILGIVAIGGVTWFAWSIVEMVLR